MIRPVFAAVVSATSWRVAFALAAFNLLIDWEDLREDDHGRTHLALAQFSL